MDDALELLNALIELREDVHLEGQMRFKQWRPNVERRSFMISGLNLACYLALRGRDLRDLQAALPRWGLSSLGGSEARVLANLDAVIATLGAISGEEVPPRPAAAVFGRGPRTLQRNATELLGAAPEGRDVRIMVTMPSEAAHDARFSAELIDRGMTVARITCAHDHPAAWAKMIEHIRAAEGECKVMMDLAGPKVCTGEVLRADKGHKHAKLGDRILLTAHAFDSIVRRDVQFQTSCSLSAALEQVAEGHTVWFDDGVIGGVVEAVTPEGLLLTVTAAPLDGKRLKAEKGINFPDSRLRLSPLTEKDQDDLDFVLEHADIIGYSFVQEADDMIQLQTAMRERGYDPAQVAVIAKIETGRAVENLPDLIAAAASQQPFGVMIARGDLAVAIGYRRLAEIQEQLLWICKAAHVPVVWATQVFEQYAKTGLPSRAEVTDAAMSERAECVMLSKGPFIAEVVTMLGAHLGAKRAQLRLWPGE